MVGRSLLIGQAWCEVPEIEEIWEKQNITPSSEASIDVVPLRAFAEMTHESLCLV
jgi:hypothetical protein